MSSHIFLDLMNGNQACSLRSWVKWELPPKVSSLGRDFCHVSQCVAQAGRVVGPPWVSAWGTQLSRINAQLSQVTTSLSKYWCAFYVLGPEWRRKTKVFLIYESSFVPPCHNKPDERSFFMVGLDFISSFSLLIVSFLMGLIHNSVP